MDSTKKKNADLKSELLENGISYSELSYKLKTKQEVLAATMNQNLSDPMRKMILEAIEEIKNENKWNEDVPLSERSAMCIYKQNSVMCGSASENNCKRCGWNPKVDAERRKIPMETFNVKGKQFMRKVIPGDSNKMVVLLSSD